MTAYYIDFVGGLDTNSGLTPALAWKTLGKYTQGVRNSGDIAYVRRAKTQVATGDIYCLTYGEPGPHIKVMADDGTGWPGEEGGARPCLDFNSGAYHLFNISGRNWWWFEGLEIKGSAAEVMIYFDADHIIFKNCLIHGLTTSAGHGFAIVGGEAHLIDCEFYDCYNIAMLADGGAYLLAEGCTLNGGAGVGTQFGLEAAGGSLLEAKDCVIGATTHFSQADALSGIPPSSRIRLRNCSLQSTVPVQLYPGCAVHSEDHQQVKGAHKSYYYQGNITKVTDVLHSGGALSSAKVEPNAYCVAGTPLTLADEGLKGDFQIWCPASATTVTVYIRSLGAWSTYPTAAQLYIDAEYWDGATAKRVLSTPSTQVLSDGTTWVAFTTTFTPSAAGWAYVRVHLAKYEASKGIYVDVKPVVS